MSAIRYSEEQRRQISKDAEGKVIESLEWWDDPGYWVMMFTDGSEISIRLMAEQE